ncbi:MAG: hypothetical protein ACK55I_13295, partial [bacterium]
PRARARHPRTGGHGARQRDGPGGDARRPRGGGAVVPLADPRPASPSRPRLGRAPPGLVRRLHRHRIVDDVGAGDDAPGGTLTEGLMAPTDDDRPVVRLRFVG